MKRIIIYSVFLALIFIITGCSGNNAGGTETGTTDIGLDALGVKVEAVASALVPTASSGGAEGSISLVPYAITYGAEGDWQTYLDDPTIVSDIFGSPDEEPVVVTKIRVLLENFRDTLEGLVETDDNFDCAETAALAALDEDTIEIAFYGPVSNGTADNRYFQCVRVENSDSGNYTTLYGRDNDGVVHIVAMNDSPYSVEDEYVAERGTTATNLAVIQAAYAEISAEGATTAYLDLQYTQASLYTGPDNSLEDTDDNISFKSRTRITGSAELDDSNNATAGVGDFIVTKYDAGFSPEGDPWTTVTKSAGRGGYDDGDYSLFKIQTNALADELDYFCLEHAAEASPANADAANCTAYETALSWDEADFPFTLTPALESVFEDVTLFEGNDTDLIASDQSNFEIPVYTTE